MPKNIIAILSRWLKWQHCFSVIEMFVLCVFYYLCIRSLAAIFLQAESLTSQAEGLKKA